MRGAKDERFPRPPRPPAPSTKSEKEGGIFARSPIDDPPRRIACALQALQNAKRRGRTERHGRRSGDAVGRRKETKLRRRPGVTFLEGLEGFSVRGVRKHTPLLVIVAPA